MTVLTPYKASAPPAPLALWEAYRASGERRLRDRLVFTLAPMVRHAGAVDDREAEAGLRALMDAVDGYDAERDGALEPYAWSRVRAALASSR
jgi:DNA-directed RNA polymerase specialized sigma subunit